MIEMAEPRSGHPSPLPTCAEPPAGRCTTAAPPVVAGAPVPVAWYGRVATDEDADLMLTRQLGAVQRTLSPGCTIVAKFYDICSGLLTPQERRWCEGHRGVELSLPRDGGLADLLTESERPERRFVAVVCMSIERIARSTYLSMKIEYELEKAGAVLLVADEGIDWPANLALNDAADPAGR